MPVVADGCHPTHAPAPRSWMLSVPFMSLTTRKCKEGKAIGMIFRISFYEHAVRNQDDYDEAARYIAENPVEMEY